MQFKLRILRIAESDFVREEYPRTERALTLNLKPGVFSILGVIQCRKAKPIRGRTDLPFSTVCRPAREVPGDPGSSSCGIALNSYSLTDNVQFMLWRRGADSQVSAHKSVAADIEVTVRLLRHRVLNVVRAADRRRARIREPRIISLDIVAGGHAPKLLGIDSVVCT